MPITDVIDVDDGEDGVSDNAGRIFAAILEHRGELRELRTFRARTAKERRRLLLPTKQITLDIDEDPDELARRCAKQIMDVIATEAAGDPWRGEVELLGEPNAKGKPTVLTSVKIELAGGAPLPPATKESEMVGVLSALRETIKGLGEVVVKIGNAKADEVSAYTKMVQEVADSVRKSSEANGKWQYRMHRETEETARTTEEARERAQKSANFWGAAEVFAEEWSGVAMVWSQFFASGAREAPKRPTDQEMQDVFNPRTPDGGVPFAVDGRPWGEVFDHVRAKVSEMLAEPDVKRRCQIAKDKENGLPAALNALSSTAQLALKMRMAAVLGEQRTKEVAAWLTMPIT